MKKLTIIIFCCLCIINAKGQFSVGSYFSDHMVLQRDIGNVIHGRANAGDKITVRIATFVRSVKAGVDNTWEVTIPPFMAGGPYEISVTCKNETRAFHDVLFGDVWLCSGQSNMEYQVSAFEWAKSAAAESSSPVIRFVDIPNNMDEIPVNDLPENITWKVATGDNILSLSATAYWFARYLQPDIRVPIGLITTDWSGTAIEPWMTISSLKKFPQYKAVTDYLEKDPKSHEVIEKEFQTYLKNEWGPKYYYKGTGMQEKWYLENTDYSTWDSIKLPCWWENAGLGLENYDGTVWFRTTFDCPAGFKDSVYFLDLNLIKDYDIAWVNGYKVGETFGDQNRRHYYVPRRILREKGNSLVLRVYNINGYGGLNFHPLWATPVLSGKWVCRKDMTINPDTIPVPRIVNKSPYGYPVVLYNAMIHPLLRTKLKGVIWYQGESNAGRAEEYRTLFPEMIQSWRKEFNNENLPFLFVQLANFDVEDTLPSVSDWAELREAQDMALKAPGTGMAVAIDLGETYNIHPRNKMEIGRRLANEALKKAYNRSEVPEYPRYESIEIRGDSIVVHLNTFGDEMIVNDKYGYIYGFAVAGADRVFKWAHAVLRNNNIVVWCPEVSHPIAVRYAWSKNPGKLSLYNKSGLPLCPFRSDNWKGVTDGRVFSLTEVFF
jgi:sialate O-acetylesterase